MAPPLSGGDAERQYLLLEVAELARSVNSNIRISQAPIEVLESVRASLKAADNALQPHAFDGPLCQVGIGEMMPESDDPTTWFPYSPVVGKLNPISPPVDLWVADDGGIEGRMNLSPAYNGPPWDLAHGGVIAAIFDEMLGLATIVEAGGGYTGRLTVRYHKPTPIRKDVDLSARVTKHEGRRLVAEGEMRCNGKRTAEASGLFIQQAGALAVED